MTKEEIQTLVMLEIVAPLAEEPDTLPQSIRRDIKQRYLNKEDWDTVFAPVPDEELRNKYISLFKELDKNE